MVLYPELIENAKSGGANVENFENCVFQMLQFWILGNMHIWYMLLSRSESLINIVPIQEDLL